MAELMKRIDEYKVFTEEEAVALIEKIKLDVDNEGYEVVSHSATLKEKKSKGEVIDAYYIVKIQKRWNIQNYVKEKIINLIFSF